MCLKFLLENNHENQEIIRSLEARGVENQEGLERDYGVRAEIQGGRVRVQNVGASTIGGASGAQGAGSGGGGSAQGMRRSMRDRRASESNAAAELLGEKFARLNVDMGQGQNQSQSFGRHHRQLHHQQQLQLQQGRIIGEAIEDDTIISDNNDDDNDNDNDNDEIDFM